MSGGVTHVDSELIPPIEVDPVLVSPGVAGFVFTFAVMVAALLLIIDMAAGSGGCATGEKSTSGWTKKKPKVRRLLQRRIQGDQ